MLDIDPVECALAAIGLKPILSREVERVTMAQVAEMVSLPKRIYKEAKCIVQGEKYKVPTESISYKKMLKELTEQYSEAQLVEMLSKFPPQLHAISAKFLVKAQQTREYLLSILPIQTKQTLLGPENLPPSTLAIRRFTTTFDILDNPMKILTHIACGSLLKSQTDAAKLVYPTLSAAITDALKEAAIDEKAEKKSYQLPAKVAIGSSVWLGQPIVSPKLQTTLQGNFAKNKAQTPSPQQQGSQPSGNSSVAAKEALSNTQHGLFPQQTQQR